MKKSVPLIAVLVAGGLTVSACGSSSTPAASGTTTPAPTSSAAGSPTSDGESSGPTGSSSAGGGEALPATTISVLAPSYADSSEADWKTIIDAFKKVQPNVTVTLQIEAWDGFSDKVAARIQAQDMPDILNDNNYGESADGLLYPVNEVMSADTLATIEPALLKNGVGTDGTQWAAPDIATSRLLVYNTDLFKKAGISAPPKTWAEMEAAATKLKAIGVAGYGMPLGKEEAQAESTLWLWGAGGTWIDGEGLKADTPAAAEGFTEMKKFIDGGLTQANPGSSNRQDVADLFNQGKVGMYVSHSGLTATTRDKFKNIKFAETPIPSKSGTPVGYGVTDFILAFNNKDEARKAATKAFLDFFYQEAQYGPWYKGTGLLPATTDAIASATTDDAVNAPFYQALKTVQFTPSGYKQWSALQSALQATAGKLQSASAADVLKEIQAQVDAAG